MLATCRETRPSLQKVMSRTAAAAGSGGVLPVVKHNESVFAVLGGVDLWGELIPGMRGRVTRVIIMAIKRRRWEDGWLLGGDWGCAGRGAAHAAREAGGRVRRRGFEPVAAQKLDHAFIRERKKKQTRESGRGVLRRRAQRGGRPAGSESVLVAHIKQKNMGGRLQRLLSASWE